LTHHSSRLHLVENAEAVERVDIPKEPVRDWALGFVTGHRVRVVAYLIGTIAVLYLVQAWMWPHSQKPHGLLEDIWSWMSILWITAVVPGTLGLLGELAFRHPSDLDDVQPISRLVVWRIVSRGENVGVLTSTVRRIQQEMALAPLFPYVIEVVTDTISPAIQHPNDDVRLIPVPQDYQTPNSSRFKARGLHYAMLHSPVPNEAWIVHLDEETQPTSSGIKGICKMIHEEEFSQRLRIGQGAILYHREWRKYPLLTLADNVRTGDDFARFHFQYKMLGTAFLGLHGSYIVVRNDVEKSTGGFDFGPKGDITEDAFWAMKAMEGDHRCRWVEGYLEEQSCMSLLDFLKQRRRWIQGLALVALYAPVKLRWRLGLGINTALWALAPFSMLYTVVHYFWGFEVNPVVHFLANYSYATFVVLYFMGLKANLDEGIKEKRLWFVRPVAYALQALLTFFPVFSLMESAGVLWAIVNPGKGFHVVKK